MSGPTAAFSFLPSSRPARKHSLCQLIVKIVAVATLVAPLQHPVQRIFAGKAGVHPPRLRVERGALVKEAHGSDLWFVGEAQLLGELLGDGALVVLRVRGLVVEGEGDLFWLGLGWLFFWGGASGSSSAEGRVDAAGLSLGRRSSARAIAEVSQTHLQEGHGRAGGDCRCGFLWEGLK